MLQAISLTRQGKYSKSLDLLEKALSYQPNNVTALVTSGANYANLGRYDDAIRDFEVALMHDPSCENAKKYLESTKQKVEEVRKISDMTSSTLAKRPFESKNSFSRSSTSSDIIVSKKHKALSKYYAGDENWSYVMSEDDEDDDKMENARHSKGKKKKKDKKSHKKKDKKRKKKEVKENKEKLSH